MLGRLVEDCPAGWEDALEPPALAALAERVGPTLAAPLQHSTPTKQPSCTLHHAPLWLQPCPRPLSTAGLFRLSRRERHSAQRVPTTVRTWLPPVTIA